MRNITVKVHPSKANLKKKEQLAWKIAEISSDKAKLNKDAIEISVALASTIIMILGGMIPPIVELTPVTAAENAAG